eukprot:scaffold26270_cov60-Attheya_sp.AAC.7
MTASPSSSARGGSKLLAHLNSCLVSFLMHGIKGGWVVIGIMELSLRIMWGTGTVLVFSGPGAVGDAGTMAGFAVLGSKQRSGHHRLWPPIVCLSVTCLKISDSFEDGGSRKGKSMEAKWQEEFRALCHNIRGGYNPEIKFVPSNNYWIAI